SGGNRRFNSFTMQVLASVVGVIVLFVMSGMDYRLLSKMWFVHLPVTLGLVLVTFTNLPIVYRPPGSDDSAWLRIAGLSLQPSELLKVSFILTFALHLSRVREDINRPKTLLLLCLHGAIPCLLIFAQGDMGSALVFFFIFLCMIFVAGLSYKYIFVGMGAAAVAAPVVWFSGMLPDYLQQRFLILGNLSSDALGFGHQQLNGRRILGSGMLFGKGLFSDDLNGVFAIENDFILSHIGQTLGFVGCAFVVLLLMSICVRILLVSRSSTDPLGCYICVGVFGMFMFQSIINIGMVLGVLPVIGITLPFISAGGTSIITSFISMGLVMSVYSFNKGRG
ncbi:MAG: FtsW/RodA/SpoVE family cell cycle protein, partial [Oscillospiraceae bacterium]